MQTKATIRPTEACARYFPVQSGRHDISPGLFRLDTDFGNGRQDQCLFQIDTSFNVYNQNKRLARDENVNKYVCHEILDTEALRSLNLFFLNHLANEQQQYFSLNRNNNGYQLHCHLTDDEIVFNNLGDYKRSVTQSMPAFIDSWDAWGCQLQEDLALIDRNNRVLALHLCAPNHWAAADKLGDHFMAVHKPVPGFKSRYPSHNKMLHSIVNKGPYVRFAWGLSTDRRLNHHPQAAPAYNDKQWQGRSFAADAEIYMRVERQCMWGMPDIGAFLFTIRTYFLEINSTSLNKDEIVSLKSAISGMDEETRSYKGIAGNEHVIFEYLDNCL